VAVELAEAEAESCQSIGKFEAVRGRNDSHPDHVTSARDPGLAEIRKIPSICSVFSCTTCREYATQLRL
jgi:hypothetical protein